MEISRDVEIINKLGMHARAAAKFVKLASQFNSKIELGTDNQRVNGKSIMGVLMLAAAKGTHNAFAVDALVVGSEFDITVEL